ncbi:transposase [Ornithinimicrobium ciconiae]|uniref:transposase n=1 Tax=Ornithinimicrobium ciconiae TaxID=2594265 RepID=UPI00192D4EBF|nr:transposase [Ornithinimicrobium ciconiae]
MVTRGTSGSTITTVTAGNTGDAEPAKDLLAADLPAPPDPREQDEGERASKSQDSQNQDSQNQDSQNQDSQEQNGESLAVYGDAAYGSGTLIADLEAAGAQVLVKVAPPTAPGGRFAKDRFLIDTTAATVTCPAGATAVIRPTKGGGGAARFGTTCATCPLAGQCTSSKAGRTIKTTRYEAELLRARTTQRDPAWRADYRATRPKVERKIGHLMRRKHGGRRARVRGTPKVAADFSLLAAAANLARLAVLGITRTPTGWAAATA